MFVGVDTGFFFALEEKHPSAVDIWNNKPIATSVIVLYELQKKLIQQKFRKWETLIEDVNKSLMVVPLTINIALKASRIACETGMPGLDVLILSSLIEAGCREIYTTDSHFELYRSKGIKIFNLEKS